MRIKMMVKILVPGFVGFRSPHPTVVNVMIVKYSGSIQLQSSAAWKNTVPEPTTMLTR